MKLVPLNAGQRRVLGIAAALPVLGAILGVVVATLLSSPGSAPQPPPTAVSLATAAPMARPTATPQSTPAPTPTPTLAPIPFPSVQPLPSGAPPVGPDPDAVPTIWAAVGRLSVLERFRFTLVVSGRNLDDLSTDGRVDYAVRGVLVRKPVLAVDGTMSFQMVEATGDAAFSATDRLLLIGDTWWRFESGKTPEPIKQDRETVRRYEAFLPDGVAQRGVLPFADGYAKVGEEVRNGILTVHYRATGDGLRRMFERLRVSRACAADLWVAKEEGYLAAAITQCPADGQVNGWERGHFVLRLEVTDVNDSAIKVVPPR